MSNRKRLIGYSAGLILLLSAAASAQIAPPPIQFGSPGDPAGPLGPDGRIPSSQMPVDALEYKGAWDAATNTPTLADGVGTTGDTYAVQTGGTQNLGGGSVNYVAGNFVIYNGTVWDQIGAGNAPVPANPTAQVGTAAVNGAASTFMRSDAAPALNLTIAPIWTGIHTFNGSTSSGTASIILGNVNPELRFLPSNGTAGTRMWRQAVQAGASSSSFNIFASTDTPGNIGYAFQAAHDGSKVTSSGLVAGAQNVTVQNGASPGITSSSGAGSWDHTGPLNVSGVATFNGSTGLSTPSIILGDIAPTLRMFNSAGATNEKCWNLSVSGSAMALQTPNDTCTAGANNAWFVTRSGTNVVSHTFFTDPTKPFTITTTDATLWSAYTPTSAKSVATKDYVDAAASTAVHVVADAALVNQAADASNGTVYAVPADGMYRASCYIVLTQAATTSATLPGCTVSYTDPTTNVAMTSLAFASSVGNTVGTHLNGTVVLEAKSGTNFGYSTTGYASSGATPMQYRVRVVLERVK